MAGEDPAYIAKVHGLPCCICDGWGMVQTTPTAAHHCKDGWHEAGRSPDSWAIPLCRCHHQGDLATCDKSKVAYHRQKKTWRSLYGPDSHFIDPTRDAIERMEALTI